jgi:hypothetical protein
MMALRSDASLQGPGRQQLAEQPSISASKSAEFEKAMFDCNLLDRRGRAAHQQRGVHVAESLAAKEGDRRHANYAQEGGCNAPSRRKANWSGPSSWKTASGYCRACARSAKWKPPSSGQPNIWAGVPICCAPSTRSCSPIRSTAVAAKRGGYGDTWRQRHDAGCAIIAQGLRGCRVPVF